MNDEWQFVSCLDQTSLSWASATSVCPYAHYFSQQLRPDKIRDKIINWGIIIMHCTSTASPHRFILNRNKLVVQKTQSRNQDDEVPLCLCFPLVFQVCLCVIEQWMDRVKVLSKEHVWAEISIFHSHFSSRYSIYINNSQKVRLLMLSLVLLPPKRSLGMNKSPVWKMEWIMSSLEIPIW